MRLLVWGRQVADTRSKSPLQGHAAYSVRSEHYGCLGGGETAVPVQLRAVPTTNCCLWHDVMDAIGVWDVERCAMGLVRLCAHHGSVDGAPHPINTLPKGGLLPALDVAVWPPAQETYRGTTPAISFSFQHGMFLDVPVSRTRTRNSCNHRKITEGRSKFPSGMHDVMVFVASAMRRTTRRIHERPLDLWHHHSSIPVLTLFVILMDSPQSVPPSTPPGSAHPSNHLGSSAGPGAHEGVMGLPWCHACRPYVHFLLSHGNSSRSIADASTAAPTWAFSSPFPDYICVPALVHRSQLAVFATPVMNPTTAASPNPSIDSVSSGSPNQRRARGVKIACTNCRTANKKCDEGRPCGRCMKTGMGDSCVSAERKQRTRRVKQTTTAITVSATQVAVETPIPGDGPSLSIPASVHIKAGTSYVKDTQEMADATYSSPVGSSLLADLDSQFTAPQYPSYSVYTNIWPTQTSTEHQYPHWGYGSDGTHQHPAAQFGGSVVGMPPDGCGGAGGMFQSPRQQF